jgi:hypothetical protein
VAALQNMVRADQACRIEEQHFGHSGPQPVFLRIPGRALRKFVGEDAQADFGKGGDA